MSGVFTEHFSYHLAFAQKLAQHLYFRLHEPGHAKRGATQPVIDGKSFGSNWGCTQWLDSL